MRISELYIHPVKGAAGIAVRAARVDDFGLADDRRWMIVDGAGRFVTQREHAGLALLRTALDDDGLLLESARGGAVRVPRGGVEPVRVRIWDDEVDALDTGAAPAAVASAHLGFAARVVYMPAASVRPVRPDYGASRDRVGFADAFPILLIGQGSLEALNARLDTPLPMRRFRPNIVVEAALPHAEDAWRRIRLGSVMCDVVKPCDRCAVTTVDPATAERGREPLRTLAHYRRWNGHVWFGQNLIHRSTGSLRVGDAVIVETTGEHRPPLPAPLLPESARQ